MGDACRKFNNPVLGTPSLPSLPRAPPHFSAPLRRPDKEIPRLGYERRVLSREEAFITGKRGTGRYGYTDFCIASSSFGFLGGILAISAPCVSIVCPWGSRIFYPLFAKRNVLDYFASYFELLGNGCCAPSLNFRRRFGIHTVKQFYSHFTIFVLEVFTYV